VRGKERRFSSRSDQPTEREAARVETNGVGLVLLPLDEGVVDERFENTHERVLVLSEDPHRDLACLSVDA
jgi:hypothetical protein